MLTLRVGYGSSVTGMDFDDSNSSDFDSILISGHLGGSKSKALNDHENRALNNAQSFNRQGTPAGMKD